MTRMLKKKSQIQIFETMAVLIVFFILLGLGFIFYSKVIKSNLESDAAEISQGQSISVAQKVMFLPEIECSEDNVPKENCIDTEKLNAAAPILTDNNNPYYYDLFGFSVIRIEEIYPVNLGFVKTLYERDNAPDYKNSFVTKVPVTLYDPVDKLNKFGMITITTKTK